MPLTTTMRFPDDDGDDLRAFAEVEGLTVSEVVRRAVRSHIDARRSDPEFQERLRRHLDEQRAVLDRLRNR